MRKIEVRPGNRVLVRIQGHDAFREHGDPVPVSVDSINRNLGIYSTDTLDVTPDLAVTASEIECSDPATPCLLPTNLAGDPHAYDVQADRALAVLRLDQQPAES
jgi:hypothetical protein